MIVRFGRVRNGLQIPRSSFLRRKEVLLVIKFAKVQNLIFAHTVILAASSMSFQVFPSPTRRLERHGP